MQQFIVPQFIDVEDKIFGPVTVRQFLILLVGGGLLFVAYKLSDLELFILWLVIIGPSFLIVAFVKINGRPMHYFLLNLIQTLKRPKLRVWQKKFTNAELKSFMKSGEFTLPPVEVPRQRIRASRLAEMSLIVDTGGIYQGELEGSLNEELH